MPNHTNAIKEIRKTHELYASGFLSDVERDVTIAAIKAAALQN
jgi:hypothetical protein